MHDDDIWTAEPLAGLWNIYRIMFSSAGLFVSGCFHSVFSDSMEFDAVEVSTVACPGSVLKPEGVMEVVVTFRSLLIPDSISAAAVCIRRWKTFFHL